MDAETAAILKTFPFLKKYVTEADVYHTNLTTKTRDETEEFFERRTPVDLSYNDYLDCHDLVENIFLLDEHKKLLLRVGDRWAGRTFLWLLLLRIPVALVAMTITGLPSLLGCGDFNYFFLEEPFPETLKAAIRRARKPAEYALVMKQDGSWRELFLDIDLYKIADGVGFQEQVWREFKDSKRQQHIEADDRRRRAQQARQRLAEQRTKKEAEEKQRIQDVETELVRRISDMNTSKRISSE